MIANFHTHTTRCRHADGTEEEYIQAAVNNGLKILGFSDHVPCPFSNGYRSGFRMDVSETAGYVSQLQMLREKYRDRIQLLIGYEAEYYPAEFDRMLENICQYECSYLLLGQHCLNNEYDGIPSGGRIDDPELLKTYVDQCVEGMQTGAYSCLAHPDLPNYCGTQTDYLTQMARICKAAKDMNIPLEINAFGLWDKRCYPNERFWRLAADFGNSAVIGSDAHWAAFTGEPEAVRAAEQFAARLGIRVQPELELRSPIQALQRRKIKQTGGNNG